MIRGRLWLRAKFTVNRAISNCLTMAINRLIYQFAIIAQYCLIFLNPKISPANPLPLFERGPSKLFFAYTRIVVLCPLCFKMATGLEKFTA